MKEIIPSKIKFDKGVPVVTFEIKREKFPSQKKYEKNNPSITFRMKRDEKDKILQMTKTTGKSISELVRTALLGQEKDFSKALEYAKKNEYERGYSYGEANGKKEGEGTGYSRGMNEWIIGIECARCGKYK